MFGSIGFTELILILMIVLIIFGAGKLPQLGEGVGKAIKGFKKSIHEAEAMDAEFQAANQQANMDSADPAQIPHQQSVVPEVPSPPPATGVDNGSNIQAASVSKA
ncbi:MAG: twin-arginine translocase TatA/TatE family subunit [Nitrospira sp.]|nr:twin-arginine translocase TatA/TatE family subunit [Nitrospira sp.]